MALPTVTIIGRINAGKSTLFNTLTETEKAITSPVPGTTRDRIIEKMSWSRTEFLLIDTGGVDIEQLKNSIGLLRTKKWKHEPGMIEKGVIKQAQKALKSADVILMVVDAQSGLMAQDRDLAKILKRYQKPIILVCNKIDSPKWASRVAEFYKLGLGQPIGVSALSGSGTGDLLDILVETLKPLISKKSKKEGDEKVLEKIRVSFIGKPSVGKSSLVNSILEEERLITSPIPQTTREPQDIELEYKDKIIVLVDTAGLKKRRNTERGLDMISHKRSLGCIKRSDIVLFVVDMGSPQSSQDVRISRMIADSTASAIIIANKWDLIPQNENVTSKEAQAFLKDAFPPISWAPIIYTSALLGKNVKKILDLVLEVYERRKIELTKTDENSLLKKIIKMKKPYGGSGTEKPFIRLIHQTKTNPPEFTILIGDDQTLDQSYLNYVEKSIRYQFDLEGVNVKIKIRN